MSTEAPRYARNLSSILLEAGVVTPAQVQSGLEHQLEMGGRFGEALVQIGAASESDIGWALSRQLGIPFIDLLPDSLDRELICGYSEATLRRLLALPIVRDDDSISIAFGDPTDFDAIAELERNAGVKVNLSVATPSSIRSMLDRVWRAHPDHSRSEPHVYYSRKGERAGAQLLNAHLSRAIAAGATEIHFLPAGSTVSVRYRVKGSLMTAGSEPTAAIDDLIARLDALGGPMFAGEDLHASGRVTCPMGDQEREIEVSLLGCEEGLAVRLGLATPSPALPLEKLGLDPVDLARLRTVIDQPAGLVLVAGPSRSGCSTTLRALAAACSRDSNLTVAFEGRGERPFGAGVHARLDSGLSRERWGEIAVAQNADVVVLDGVLTGESVAGVLSSRASGRMLLASTDWCDSFALLDYLITRPAGAATIADRLHVVIEQRMLQPDGERTPLTSTPRPLFEVLFVSDPLRERLRSGARVCDLYALARADGHRRLADHVRSLVEDGRVSASAASRLLA